VEILNPLSIGRGQGLFTLKVVPTPVDSSDAVNKEYVDSLPGGEGQLERLILTTLGGIVYDHNGELVLKTGV